jgi:hypothetical protein
MDRGRRRGACVYVPRPERAVRVASVLAAAGCLCAAAGAPANPAILLDGGAGGALLPRNTEDVRIVSERLEFTESTEDPTEPTRYVDRWEIRQIWHVRADYVLENLTDGKVEAEVGFPVAGERGEWDYGDPEGPSGFGRPIVWPFARSFHVRLDGNELEHRQVDNPCPAAEQDGETVADAGGPPAGACYPFLFVFPLALEPRAQVSLTVEYDQRPSLCCGADSYPEYVDMWIGYVLETGALWAGTIGRLDIVYAFAVPPVAGVRVYADLAGPRMPHEGPWREQDDEGNFVGHSPKEQRIAAPEGVLDLWDPAVRFHYAFACRNGRIVLRLKATDVDPRGNISVGVAVVGDRLRALAEAGLRRPMRPGQGAGEEEEYERVAYPASAATRRSGSEDSDAAGGWTLSTWPDRSPGSQGSDRLYAGDAVRTTVAELPADWRCRFEHAGREYGFDCCAAAVAVDGHWNPDCDKPGHAGGKGCAAAAGPVATLPATSADAGAVDAGEAGAELDAAEPDAEAAASDVVEAGAAELDAGKPVAVTEASSSSPDAAPPPPVDASTAPASAPARKGCGCVATGESGAAGPALAVFVALVLRGGRRARRAACRRDPGRI